MKNRKKDTRWLVGVAMMAAIVVLLANTPLGMIQLPIIKAVIEDLQGFGACSCTSVSATPVNWVMDRILGKF